MPPWFDFEFSYMNQDQKVKYSVDTFLNFIMFLRIYLVLRLSTKFTKWRNKKSERICNREGIEADTLFALKCLMQDAPYLVVFVSFLISSLILGFAVRTVERPYYFQDVEV
jgi:hypothetical protein